MTLYKKITHSEDIKQWDKLGDHNAVKQFEPALTSHSCSKCHQIFALHGEIKEGKLLVCPGDFIVNESYGWQPMKPEIFKLRYEEVK